MAPSSVPVSGDGLGVQRANNAELLANAVQQVPGHPQLVTRLDAHARAHLVLPLAWHHLPVGSGDFDAGEEARLVVRLHDVAAEGVLVPDRAVVRALLLFSFQGERQEVKMRKKAKKGLTVDT